MALAFVLLNLEPGSEDEVREEISQMEEVDELHLVYGTYDMVIKLHGEDMDDIKKVVTGNIRRLEKVRSTLTMLVVES